jgi:hypothetical protein
VFGIVHGHARHQIKSKEVEWCAISAGENRGPFCLRRRLS